MCKILQKCVNFACNYFKNYSASGDFVLQTPYWGAPGPRWGTSVPRPTVVLPPIPNLLPPPMPEMSVIEKYVLTRMAFRRAHTSTKAVEVA